MVKPTPIIPLQNHIGKARNDWIYPDLKDIAALFRQL